jgi:O-antigen/teichoic acid export membrane protein
MVAQFSLMGAPQIVLRNVSAPLPMAGILLHSLALAIPLALITLWGSGVTRGPMLLTIMAACGLVVQTLSLARLKNRRRFDVVLIAESAGALILLGAMAFVLRLQGSHLVRLSYAAVFTFDAAAIAIISAVALSHQRRSLSAEFTVQGIRRLLPSVYSVGGLLILESLFWRLQIYALNLGPDGVQGVGVFALAMQLIQPVFLAATAMIEPWWPEIAAGIQTGPTTALAVIEQRERLYQKLFFSMIGGFVLLLPLVVTLAFPKYSAWSSFIYAFVVIRLLGGLSGFWSSVLYAAGNEKRLYRPTLTAMAVALVGTATLTLHVGLWGAVTVFGFTQLTLFVSVRLAYDSYRGGLAARAEANA